MDCNFCLDMDVRPEAKHTQPLSVERSNAGAEHPLFIFSPGKDGIRPWNDADAHLWAAAPELLEACKAIASLCSWDLVLPPNPALPPKGNAAFKAVSEAIAKAEGRS